MSLMYMDTVSASRGRRVSERLLLASKFIFRFDSSSHESQAKIGYKWSLRQSQFKATVDSNGVVAASLEEMISPVLKLVLNGIFPVLGLDMLFPLNPDLNSIVFKK